MPPKRVSLENRTALETPKAQVADTAPAADASGLWRKEAARQEVVMLDLTQIMPNPRQPRTIFDQSKLEELADSIREHGVIQPVIVQPIPLTKWEGHARRYALIAGERRWRASLLAGQTSIPVLIRQDTSDHGTLIELALIENLQRADLHPLEEAMAFGTMRDQLGYSIRRIGERVSRSKGYVENRLKLLDLDSELQQLVSERPDTLMHVGELAKVADREMRTQLVTLVREGLSYAETQARVRQLLTPPSPDIDEKVSLRKDTENDTYDVSPARIPSEVSLRKDTESDTYDVSPARIPSEVSLRKDTQLNSQDREQLDKLSSRLAMWLNHPERLSEDDWLTFAPVAQRLIELSRRIK